jgi:hypothetical protein
MLFVSMVSSEKMGSFHCIYYNEFGIMRFLWFLENGFPLLTARVERVLGKGLIKLPVFCVCEGAW